MKVICNEAFHISSWWIQKKIKNSDINVTILWSQHISALLALLCQNKYTAQKVKGIYQQCEQAVKIRHKSHIKSRIKVFYFRKHELVSSFEWSSC